MKLRNAQHAYLKGQSVESALLDVVDYIEHVFRFKEYTLVAFLDIKGDFNYIETKRTECTRTLGRLDK